MNNDILFTIENEELGYKTHPKPVIHVEKLTIEAGKLVIIIGISGAGKSTLLETLGLMRNSVLNRKTGTGGENIRYNSSIFLNKEDDGFVSLKDLWNRSGRAKINHIRKMHFSFIFQNTNLMPNFSIEENILSMASIQNKYSSEELKKRFVANTKEMGLPEDIFKNNPANISGGQKQRAAFLRAILPDYTVLFGDEPTGNLDERFAEELMKKIQDSIKRNKENSSNNNKTAILVSHNIPLSLRFADKIVVLSKVKANEPPVINNNTIISKTKSNSWSYCKNTFNDEEVAGIIRELMYQNTMF